jgi:hypothetical protein
MKPAQTNAWPRPVRDGIKGETAGIFAEIPTRIYLMGSVGEYQLTNEY